MKNWKTSLGGFLVSIGFVLQSSEKPTNKLIGQVLGFVGGIFGGYHATDKTDKT
jgi:hypothetical protein